MEYVTIKTFEEYKIIIKEKPITLIQIYADWCKPCSKISIDMELDNKWLNNKEEEIKWVKIKVEDIDEDEELKELLIYNKIPTFYFILDSIIRTDIETSNYDKLCDFIKESINKHYFDYNKLIIENFESF